MNWRIFTVFPLAGLAACHEPPTLSVDHGYVRLGTMPSRPSAGYFTIHGGPTETTLIAVNSPVAVKSELHESMTAGGMATMKPLGDLKIPALSTTEFKPGGKHLMLFDMNPGIKPGRPITLTFTFSDGRRIDSLVPTIAPGAPAPTFKD
ncbi:MULTISPECIES: copper chaperone PCu(A)C [Sphingomonas]|uniref:copper chaperone PCu(A)C n=1 Tax=Sphingomonas TaxID=13687 RepID=UPI002413A513|nr:copper chaperone PCu(A)C [Sphingomonas echinoides]